MATQVVYRSSLHLLREGVGVAVTWRSPLCGSGSVSMRLKGSADIQRNCAHNHNSRADGLLLGTRIGYNAH